MSEQHQKEYLSRIHRAQDYIEQHLHEKMRLEDIARAACFSPYHFHRVFSAVTGETLYQFILRLRLERAAWQLCDRLERTVTEIALDLGFSDSATFARAFHAAFGMSATEYRKTCKTDRKDRKAPGPADGYLGDQAISPVTRRLPMNQIAPKLPLSIDVRNLPTRTLAYLRHVGPYAGNDDLFGRLWGQFFQWAGPRGYMQRPGTECLCLYHDNPDVTSEDKLRISLGVTVEPATKVTPPINLLEIPGGSYVCAKYELDSAEFSAAWTYVMGVWMASSGYQLDDRPCYESILNDPKTHPQGKHIVEICVGVKPL